MNYLKIGYLVSIAVILPLQTTAANYYVSVTGSDCRPPGSTDNIYFVTTADDFDSVMRGIPPNSNIYLCAGTFLTRGANINGPAGTGFTMQSGWKIYGAGNSQTTGTVVRLYDVVVFSNADYNNIGMNTVFQGYFSAGYSGMEVHDLVADCNGINIYNTKPAGTTMNIGAITMFGNNCKIDNVSAINACGDLHNKPGNNSLPSETFILKIGNYNESVSGISINNSTVSQVYNPFGNCAVTAIQLGGGSNSGLYFASGGATNNVVTLTGSSSAADFAYNISAVAGVTFKSNKSFSAKRAFSNDAEANSCVKIILNEFHVPANGYGAFLLTSQDSDFESNTIYVEGGGSEAITIAGTISYPGSPYYPNPTTVKRWWVKNNSVVKGTGLTGFAMGFDLQPTINGQTTSPTDMRVENNWVDVYFYNQVPTAGGNSIVGYVSGNVNNNNSTPGGFPIQPSGTASWVSLPCSN